MEYDSFKELNSANEKSANKEDLLKRLGVFLIGALVIFLYLNVVNNVDYYHDTKQYVVLSQTFKGGLNEYPQFHRGYLLPLIIYIPSTFMEIDMSVRFVSAIFNSAIMCIMMPLFFNGYSKKNSSIRILISLGIAIFFWSGIFIYPLSETYSILFLLVSVYFTKRIIEYQLLNNTKKDMLHLGLYAFVAGLASYAAYNIRTIYLFSVYCIVIGIVIITFKKFKKYLPLVLIAFIAGYILISIPQIIINYNHYSMYTTKVIAEYGKKSNLFIWQLELGIRMQLYETFVGSPEQYGSAAIGFGDLYGQRLLAIEGISGFENIGQYIKFCLKYPLAMSSMYLRHFINCLNPMYGEIYIKDLYKTKIHLTLINYSFMFISISSIFITLKEKFKNKDIKYINLGYIIPLIVPIILIIPGAVEVRFFVMGYLFMYGYLACGVDFKKIYIHFKNNKCTTIISFVFVLLCLYSVWTNTYATFPNSQFILK